MYYVLLQLTCISLTFWAKTCEVISFPSFLLRTEMWFHTVTKTQAGTLKEIFLVIQIIISS